MQKNNFEQPVIRNNVGVSSDKVETHQHYTEYDSRSIPNLAIFLRSSRTILHTFANGNAVIARSIPAEVSTIGSHHYEVAFGYFLNGAPMEFTNSEFFGTDDSVSAAAAFVFRVNDDEPALTTGLGKTLAQVSAAHDANDSLRKAKSYLRAALLEASNIGVEGLGRVNSLQDMISRLNAMEKISSVRK